MRFAVQMHPSLWLVRGCDFRGLRGDFQSLGGRLNHVTSEKSSTNQNPYETPRRPYRPRPYRPRPYRPRPPDQRPTQAYRSFMQC